MLAGKLGSWSIDIDSRILVTSPLCREIYGRNAGDGFTYDDLLGTIHPADLGRMQAAVGRSVHRGEDCNIDYRTIWPDGSEHWVQVNGRVLKDHDGATKGLVGVLMDITDRKNIEKALRNANENLERRVLERTSELERSHDRILDEIRQCEQVEDQLRPAQKMEIIGSLPAAWRTISTTCSWPY